MLRPELAVPVDDQHSLFKEPEIYVRIREKGISFELPIQEVVSVFCQLASILRVKMIRIRYDEDGEEKMLNYPVSQLRDLFKEMGGILEEKPVVIEYGKKGVLYSNGGGCLWLKTSVKGDVKKNIVEHFLRIYGFSEKVQTEAFTAFGEKKGLKVIQP